MEGNWNLFSNIQKNKIAILVLQWSIYNILLSQDIEVKTEKKIQLQKTLSFLSDEVYSPRIFL